MCFVLAVLLQHLATSGSFQEQRQPTQKKDLENKSHRTSSSSMFWPYNCGRVKVMRQWWSKLLGRLLHLQGDLRHGLTLPGTEEQWSLGRWSCIVDAGDGNPPWSKVFSWEIANMEDATIPRPRARSQASSKSWVESFSSFHWRCNGLAEVCYWAVCLMFVFPPASAVFKKKCPYFPFTNPWEQTNLQAAQHHH